MNKNRVEQLNDKVEHLPKQPNARQLWHFSMAIEPKQTKEDPAGYRALYLRIHQQSCLSIHHRISIITQLAYNSIHF